jgi:transposase-like protein
MEDFPRTLQELESRFATDAACRAYLLQIRWPEGISCSRCQGQKGWWTSRGLWTCRKCGFQVSVTAGTIFQDTRSPLTQWFRAIWWTCSQKNGASALGLQRVLGLGSYQTAWAWLHKIRRAMVRPGRDRLSGTVEVDEAYLGAPSGETRGRRAGNKALIVVAAQGDGAGIGRIRMRKIKDASDASLWPFIHDAIEPGSVVHTDGWLGYGSLSKSVYVHEVTTRKVGVSELLPRVHQVISLLKRWLMGTHQGAVSHAHLDYYLDEFTFRFNRRTSRSRGKLFFRLLQQGMAIGPSPYATLAKHVRGPKAKNHKMLRSLE